MCDLPLHALPLAGIVTLGSGGMPCKAGLEQEQHVGECSRVSPFNSGTGADKTRAAGFPHPSHRLPQHEFDISNSQMSCTHDARMPIPTQIISSRHVVDNVHLAQLQWRATTCCWRWLSRRGMPARMCRDPRPWPTTQPAVAPSPTPRIPLPRRSKPAVPNLGTSLWGRMHLPWAPWRSSGQRALEWLPGLAPHPMWTRGRDLWCSVLWASR